MPDSPAPTAAPLAPAATPYAVELQHLCKRFDAVEAVKDVSFTVAPGEIFGLLGPNGAGKSTLIRMLTTLVQPTSGSARVAGFDILRQTNEVRLAIGVIPQNMTSDPDLTCAENLKLHCQLYGLPAHERERIIPRLLEQVKLADRADAFVRTLSGGMRRRLEIARGLVHDPSVLFLDEPSTGLDPASRLSVWEMIVALREHQGLTMVLTTHYMDEADKLCDRIAIVDQGRMVALDTPTALKASVPAASVIEARLAPDLPEGVAALEPLTGVQRVVRQGPALYRLFSQHGPSTAEALMELARRRQLEIQSLAVQSTTLDDVFMHFTGRGLVEAQQSAAPGNGGGGRRR